MKKFVLATLALAAMASAHSQTQFVRECTEVEGFGKIVLACKNVPAKPSTPSTPSTPAKPSTEPVIVPAPRPLTIMVQDPLLAKRAYSGIAQAASLDMLRPSAVGKTTVNVGAAEYSGQAALGVMIAHQATQGLVVNAGFSMGSSGRGLVKLGAGFEF